MSGGTSGRGLVHIAADAETLALLSRLVPEFGAGEAQERADALLARIAWSRLAEPGDATAGALVAALGPGRALDLLASRVGAGAICEAVRAAGSDLSPRAVSGGVRRWLPRLDRAATLGDLERAISGGMSVVVPGAPGWPERLDDLGDHAPLVLWVRGSAAAPSAFSLAVVGARACTGYGSHVTAELTDSACTEGVAVVSGGAYGVDAVAHRTALAAGATTVAVVAGGIDRPYPAAHTELFERIAAAGAICSEMVPGSAPTRWRFLMRNRLIAALARATLVTEAGSRSGSLNTAGHAAEIGRPLGAVPGPVTSAASAGCHRLIREYGASLVTNGAETRELLGLDGVLLDQDPAESTESAGRQPSLHQRVIDALPLRGARAVMEVVRLAGVSPEDARNALAELEALGAVERCETPSDAETRWKLLRRQ